MAPAIKSRTGDAVNLKKSIVLRPSVVELPWGNFASRIQGWGGEEGRRGAKDGHHQRVVPSVRRSGCWFDGEDERREVEVRI